MKFKNKPNKTMGIEIRKWSLEPWKWMTIGEERKCRGLGLKLTGNY
jgi:hypothetical protein